MGDNTAIRSHPTPSTYAPGPTVPPGVVKLWFGEVVRLRTIAKHSPHPLLLDTPTHSQQHIHVSPTDSYYVDRLPSFPRGDSLWDYIVCTGFQIPQEMICCTFRRKMLLVELVHKTIAEIVFVLFEVERKVG